jgi:hypothetical protein
LYSSTNIIRQIKLRKMRWAEHVARKGEKRKVYKVLVGKPVRRIPLGRPRSRWQNGIRVDLTTDWLRGEGCGVDSAGQG